MNNYTSIIKQYFWRQIDYAYPGSLNRNNYKTGLDFLDLELYSKVPLE